MTQKAANLTGLVVVVYAKSNRSMPSLGALGMMPFADSAALVLIAEHFKIPILGDAVFTDEKFITINSPVFLVVTASVAGGFFSASFCVC